MANVFLKPLRQYHFNRDDFVDAFRGTFTNDQIEEIETLCMHTWQTDDFMLFWYADEFYIVHKESGIVINWYKHLGRTNTCSKPRFTLEGLKEFLWLLKEDLNWQ